MLNLKVYLDKNMEGVLCLDDTPLYNGRVVLTPLTLMKHLINLSIDEYDFSLLYAVKDLYSSIDFNFKTKSSKGVSLKRFYALLRNIKHIDEAKGNALTKKIIVTFVKDTDIKLFGYSVYRNEKVINKYTINIEKKISRVRITKKGLRKTNLIDRYITIK